MFRVFRGKRTEPEILPQDTCRDPAVQQAYANDPLCKQVGTYRGVADMLLGVRVSSRPLNLAKVADFAMLPSRRASKSSARTTSASQPRFLCSLCTATQTRRVCLVNPAVPMSPLTRLPPPQVTDCDSSREFVDKVKSLGAKDATFKSFPGYYHEMHNEPGDDKWVEINFVREWIEQHIPASTSTAATTTTTTTKQPDLPSLEGAAAGSSGASEVPGLASEAGGAEGGDGVGADDAAASAKVQEGRERESKL